MDNPRDRLSGIPRLSRLPVPRATNPKPAPATSTNPSFRPRPSRDDSGGEELNLPKLRVARSRDSLRSSTNGANSLGSHEKRLKTVSPSDQRSRSNERQTTTAKARPHSTCKRNSIVSSFQKSSDATETRAEVDQSAGSDLYANDAFRPSHTQDRTPQSPPSLPLDSLDISDNVENDGAEANHDNAAAIQTPRTHKIQPGPSLSERTMRTLAQIPSSPALHKSSSSFLDQARPPSRAVRRSSPPASSRHSYGPGRTSSSQGSRPGSSADYDLPSTPSFRTSSAPFNTSISAVSGTPQRTYAPGRAKTPQASTAPNRMPLMSSAKLASSGVLPRSDVARSPSPSIASFKAVAGRPARPRSSAQGLFKKPSLAAMRGLADSTDYMHGSETAWDGSIPHPGRPAAIGANQSAAALRSRKSSAALREQIAKAKAAKRAAVRQTSESQETTIKDERQAVSNDDFINAVEYEDPFNLRKAEKPGTKVLQQRIHSARTTGRLNIAALGLKGIPPEVMDMYNLQGVGGQGHNWAESVDLTRLVAADNEIERLDDDVFPDKKLDSFVDDDDDGQGNIFGGLETLDLHGNLLSAVPLGFRRLAHLTSLNLSSNKLGNDSLATISQIRSLRDLKLSKNLLSGPLDAAFLNLDALEMIDLHGNNITALPPSMETMSHLRVVNLNENRLETIPFQSLSKLPLTELSIRRNRLTGVLIQQPIEALAYLQTLDASANQLTHLVHEGSKISLPAVHTVSLSVNRLQSVPDVSAWTSLLTLNLDENHIACIPESFTTLQKLRHADFSSNDISVVPPEISRMQGLTMIRLTGNPLRDRKLVSASTDELKAILAARLEPPPPYQEPSDQSIMAGYTRNGGEMDNKLGNASEMPSMALQGDDARSDGEDDFTTPPTSAPHTPTRSRLRSETVVKDVWFVKPGGLLDLSRCGMSSLVPQTCSAVAARNQVRQIQLHHNPIAMIPMPLTSFGSTLSVLSLAHAQLAGESYLAEPLNLPALRELSIMSNQVTSLGPLTQLLQAPVLEKLDATLNRITTLPSDLKRAFPQLCVLLVPSNQLTQLEPDSIRGLRMVDASSNDIGQLDPRLGLLWGAGGGGLQRLDVTGNRFRVPRWTILEQGTEATLRWLRGRLPAEDMAAWRADHGEETGDDDVVE
ncbi:hypothetical protein E4U41_001164 [Claviceps citrina]|nr:hypothetical protein E4U41_001164 [Claviceps citrina]